jgi:hypothetical protein
MEYEMEAMEQVPDTTVTPIMAYKEAWKYVGYHGFSRFLSFHDNFFQFRLYRALNARVILAMQDYISELEEKLTKIDIEMTQQTGSDRVHNGSYRYDPSKERRDLIWELRRRLKDYSITWFPEGW